MVQAKNRKQRQKKQLHVKKREKQYVIYEFSSQLDSLGLKITEVTADGNCFFRALADQLEGNEGEHEKYRSMVVKHILENREIFEPFIEDDEPFDEYCQSMGKTGAWAGNMELQAASLVTRCNLCIHQNRLPRWYIHNFKDSEAHMIHLSYHDGEHYNSVRLKDDPSKGPARPIIIKADTDVSSAVNQAKFVHENYRSGYDISEPVKIVMEASGCECAPKVEEVLLQVKGDVDAALKLLICEHEKEGDHCICNVGQSVDTENGENKLVVENGIMQQSSSSTGIQSIHHGNGFRHDKKVPRNKVCPCGSRKKYKACCGSVNTKSATESTIIAKSKKDKKRAKKGIPAEVETSIPEARHPDLGALCI